MTRPKDKPLVFAGPDNWGERERGGRERTGGIVAYLSASGMLLMLPKIGKSDHVNCLTGVLRGRVPSYFYFDQYITIMNHDEI